VRKFLFFLFFLSIGYLKAQPTLDTIKLCLQHSPRPFANLDSRYSFINNEVVTIFGVKAGIVFGKRVSFGIGYNQLYTAPQNFNEEIHYINSFGKENTVIKGLKLYYISLNMEYVFYQTRHWQLGMPLQVGVGQTYYQYNINGVKTNTDKNFNFIYEPTISVNYKILKWIGIGTDFGYRFMLANSRKLKQNFNAPIVTFGVLIYYSEIYKSLFPKTKFAKRL
jgi:hypothetical protein